MTVYFYAVISEPLAYREDDVGLFTVEFSVHEAPLTFHPLRIGPSLCLALPALPPQRSTKQQSEAYVLASKWQAGNNAHFMHHYLQLECQLRDNLPFLIGSISQCFIISNNNNSICKSTYFVCGHILWAVWTYNMRLERFKIEKHADKGSNNPQEDKELKETSFWW